MKEVYKRRRRKSGKIGSEIFLEAEPLMQGSVNTAYLPTPSEEDLEWFKEALKLMDPIIKKCVVCGNELRNTDSDKCRWCGIDMRSEEAKAERKKQREHS